MKFNFTMYKKKINQNEKDKKSYRKGKIDIIGTEEKSSKQAGGN